MCTIVVHVVVFFEWFEVGRWFFLLFIRCRCTMAATQTAQEAAHAAAQGAAACAAACAAARRP